MNMRILSPADDLVGAVAELLPPEGRDFSGQLIVFPGRRPGHFLRKTLAEKVGGSFLPPVIHSMDEWIDACYERLEQKRKIGPVDAVAILHDIQTGAPARIGGSHFLSLDSFFPIGLTIFRDLEELLIERAALGDVSRINDIAPGSVPEGSLARLQSVACFYDRFYRRIEELGFSTRSVRYRSVAERLEEAGLDRFSQITFAGFFALTRTERALFRALAEQPGVCFLFQQGRGLEERLKEIGFSPETLPEKRPLPEISFYSSPDSHGQIFGLNAVLEGLMPLDERCAVVLPCSEMLFPLIRQGLSGLDETDYNISIGYPLERTPLFGFLQNLMDLIRSMEGDRVYLPAYLNFVLHPYTKNIYYQGNAEVTRIVFHALEEHLSRTSVRTFIRLEEIETNGELGRKVVQRLAGAGLRHSEEEMAGHLRSIHDRTIRAFLSFRSVADFAARCSELLTFVFNTSTAKLHPFFGRYAEAFLQALGEMEHSLLGSRSFGEREGYFALLRRCLGSGSVPFEGTPVRGLQVLGMLETRNLKFNRVFVLQANEEVLPSARKEDSLLPFKARTALGLPTYREREQLAAYNVDLLIQGAKEAHLFFVESDSQERSRFVEQLLWQKQQRDGRPSDRDYIRPVQYRVKLNNGLPGEIEKTPEILAALKNFTFSPSSLDIYFRCPLRFYYKHLLKIGRRDDLTGEIARTDIGSIVHAILKSYFETRKGRLLVEADMDASGIRAITGSHFRTVYGSDLVGAHYLLEKQVSDHLADLINAYYLPLVRENRIEVLETELKDKDGVDVDGFRLGGTIDCVVRRNGKIMILDYKTGSATAFLKINGKKLDPGDPDTWRSAIGSLQLPCYVMMYAVRNNLPPGSIDAAYLMIGRSVITRDIELPVYGSEDGLVLYNTLDRVIRTLLREIADGSVPFTAAYDMKRSCPSCDFRFICGTQWIADRR